MYIVPIIYNEIHRAWNLHHKIPIRDSLKLEKFLLQITTFFCKVVSLLIMQITQRPYGPVSVIMIIQTNGGRNIWEKMVWLAIPWLLPTLKTLRNRK